MKSGTYAWGLALALGLAAAAATAAERETLERCGDGSVVEFCRLAREDFRAETKPTEVRHRVDAIDSVACTGIHLNETPVEITNQNRRRARVEISGAQLVATFDRDCSWWGSDPADVEAAVLHHQVHFAINQVAARYIFRDWPGREIIAYGPTVEQALEHLELKKAELIAQTLQLGGYQHAAFDALTRADASQATLDSWVERYEKLLGVEF